MNKKRTRRETNRLTRRRFLRQVAVGTATVGATASIRERRAEAQGRPPSGDKPNIVICIADDQTYFAMPLCKDSLANLIDKRGPLPEAVGLRIARELAAGLASPTARDSSTATSSRTTS